MTNLTNSDPVAQIGEQFALAFEEMMLEHGICLTPGAASGSAVRNAAQTMVSVLGATAPGVALICTVNADHDFLTAVHPFAGQALTPDQLEDWSRELNNQVIGRLKNKLVLRGCELALGIPSVVMGQGLRSLDTPGLTYVCFQAQPPSGAFGADLRLGLLLDPTFALQEPVPEAAADEPMLEGVSPCSERVIMANLSATGSGRLPLAIATLIATALLLAVTWQWLPDNSVSLANAAPPGATWIPISLDTPPDPSGLVTGSGRPFGVADLRGRWTLLFFGFTGCSQVCPATMQLLSRR